jgi:FtsH-binding integral membrane protein
VLHLVVFVSTPRLMNLPAMNLAAFCMALLLLYCSFFAGIFLEPPCVEVAIVTHYSFLATFCWMLIISFDVWRVIRSSKRKLQVSSGENKKV